MHNAGKTCCNGQSVNVFIIHVSFLFLKGKTLSFPLIEFPSIHQYGESCFRLIWHNRLYLYTAAALLLGLLFSLKMAVKKVRHLLLVMSKSVIRYS